MSFKDGLLVHCFDGQGLVVTLTQVHAPRAQPSMEQCTTHHVLRSLSLDLHSLIKDLVWCDSGGMCGSCMVPQSPQCVTLGLVAIVHIVFKCPPIVSTHRQSQYAP